MPKEYEEIKASLKTAHPDWTDATLAERASMTFAHVFGTNVEHAHKLASEGKWEDYKKQHANSGEKKEFDGPLFSTGIELKEVGGDFYIEGFVSSPTIDLLGDVVHCQESIVNQLNSGDTLANKLSYKHDWMKKDVNPLLPAFGKLTKAELREHPRTHLKSAWASYKLNPAHPQYTEGKKQIEDGFIDSFSIEHKPREGDAVWSQIGNVRTRGLKDTRLVGVGVASRPVQPDAVLTDFYAKSFGMNDLSITTELTQGASALATSPAKSFEKKEVGAMAENAPADDQVIADLRKQLEAKSLEFDKSELERKEMASKLSDLPKIAEQKELMGKELENLRQERKVMLEAKEVDALEDRKKLDLEMKEFQEKPSWDGATALLEKIGLENI